MAESGAESPEEMHARHLGILWDIEDIRIRTVRMEKLSAGFKDHAANIATVPWVGMIALMEKMPPPNNLAGTPLVLATACLSATCAVEALGFSERYKEKARDAARVAAKKCHEIGLDREDWMNRTLSESS